MKGRRFVTTVAVLLLSAAVGMTARASGKDGKDGDKDKVAAAQDATVQFAMPQPNPAGPTTHFLLPDDVAIKKGGTVTFIVNGAAHGIAIHKVSKNTTRDDIAADLCQGPAGSAESDRAARATVCNGAVVTTVIINGVAVTVTGTQNLDYMITDGKGNLVIEPGFNIANSNPRLDDAVNGIRLLATSGDSPGDANNPPIIAGNRAGGFLAGTALPATTGNRIRVRFEKTGRYLVICMNRAHSLNDHMFGFVSVVGDGDDDDDQ